MQKFIGLAISGAVSGAVFSVLASGLVLSYSTSGIFNLSHAAVAYATAVLYYELHIGIGWPIVPAAIVAIVVFAPLLGWLLDRIVFRSLAAADDATKLVATVGLLVAIPAFVLWGIEIANDLGAEVPDGSNIIFPPGLGPAPKVSWKLMDGVFIDSNQLIILGTAVVAATVLWFLVGHTRIGLQWRATVDRRELAGLRGIDAARSSRSAWLLAFLLAGLAGVVGAPVFALTPASYTNILFVAVTAAVLGGLRSIPLAFVGGLVVGVAQNLVAGYADFASDITGFATAVPFVLLLAGLLFVRRERAEARGSSRHAPAPPPEYHDDIPRWRQAAPWVLAGAGFLVYLVGFADRYWLGLFAKGLGYGVLFMSFVVLTGSGGMVSLAQAAFATSAALTTGLLISHDVPFLVAVLVGVLVAMAAGLVVALPTMRLGGVPLALATLALGVMGERVLFAWERFSNGQVGWSIPRPELGPLDLANDRTFALVAFALVLLAALLVDNLRRSPTGRAVVAVRTSESAAAASGVSPVASKLRVFATSAGLAGFGGIVLTSFDTNVSGVSFPTITGLTWLAIVVLFGVRTWRGALLAGVMFSTGPEVLGWFHDSTYLLAILSGFGAVQLAKAPDGILSLTARQNAERRARWRARAARRAAAPAGSATAASQSATHAGADGAAPATLGVASDGDGPSLADATDVAEAPEAADRVRGAVRLEVRDLSAGYGARDVITGVDLVVRAGEISALLGPNGAGKSTLCAALGGALRATHGTISLAGRDLTSALAHVRTRHGVILVPESRGVFPGLTVEENLAVRLATPAERDRAYDGFPVLRERRSVLGGRLSGGEQQMLALAPLVVRPPDVLIADEPTLGLSPLVVERVLEILVELRDRGTAILLVEEKPQHIMRIADSVTFLELGRITWSGPVAAASDERLAALYLGARAARTLADR